LTAAHPRFTAWANRPWAKTTWLRTVFADNPSRIFALMYERIIAPSTASTVRPAVKGARWRRRMVR
jgi:hypothetical protein